MSAYTVHQDQLPELFKLWAKLYQVHVPVEIPEGGYDFRPWGKGQVIAWDYDLTVNSLKRYLLPPKEDLITFDAETYEAEGVFEAPAQMLFGVHPYDLRAIAQLDQLMHAGSPDQNYLKRREKTVVFGMEPMRVAPDSFWSSMGAGRADLGFDLYWTKIGPSTFFVEVGTSRGEELLLSAGTMASASAAQYEAARRAREDVRRMADRNSLDFPWEELPALLNKSWDSQLWRERSRMCLSCGTCNLICPTCYCFDIKEEVDASLKKGRRYREWDSCMLNSFALVAGGHNFRDKALERFRHRYFRKGKYIIDDIGEPGCVGCGRCVRSCTAGIANPLEVFNQLWKENA